MPEYLTPGVYIEELNTGNKPIEGVSTSTVGFLGVAERGPTKPTLITSFRDFLRAYGGYYADPKTKQQYYLAFGIEGFFQNGGKRCFVQRVLSSSAKTAKFSSADGLIEIDALGPGAWGEWIAVKLEKSTGDAKRLTCMYWSSKPPTDENGKLIDPSSRDPKVLMNPLRQEPQIVEVYDDLSSNSLSTNFYGTQINDVSTLISVAVTGDPAIFDLTLLKGGDNGSTLVPGDFTGLSDSGQTGNAGQRVGLDAFVEIEEIALLCCPDAHALGDDSVNRALYEQCELLKSRFAILDSTQKNTPPGSLSISYNSKYAAFYYPWVYIIEPQSGQKILIPPGGHIAGIYARSDNARGVQKDPANEPLYGVDSLLVNLTDGDQAILNPQGINLLRYFKGYGNLVWGGRTTSHDPAWRYINVRRIFIYVEQSILRAMQWAVFEDNSEPVWAQIRRSVSDFLTRLWMDDVLQGATKEEAFFVRCDRTTMTQYDIENGRLICVIGIAPVRPAEFVIFRIGQWAGGSSVSEQ